jgi:cytochrome c oxidase subunit 1
MTGRMMSETLGKTGFWMIFIGFQLAFFPMHISGINGMARRVYTYPAGMGLEVPNMISTLGGAVVAASILLFTINLLVSLRRGKVAGPNPWDASSLEWATSSPPPPYNFPHIPVVSSRTPLWDAGETLPVVTGLRVDDKELLLTTVMSARPDIREPVAEPSIWPFISAVTVSIVFISAIFSPWAVLFGSVPIAIALIAWFWPKSLKPGPEPVVS